MRTIKTNVSVKSIYKNLPLKKIQALILLGAVSMTLSGCGKTDAQNKEVKAPVEVSAQSLKDSGTLKVNLQYSAMVSADQEAKIFAKTNGTAKDVRFNTGDKVKMGTVLARIDDAGNAGTSSFNSSQVKQAQIAVSQALASYQMAQTNYRNLLSSSQKDLAQAEIARDQSAAGKSNTNSSLDESLKGAELAYEAAKLAASQAKLALDNRKKISGQTETDTVTNADSAADSAANTCNSVITSINNVASLDEFNSVNIPYKNVLGVMDPNTLSIAKTNYQTADVAYQKYAAGNFKNIDDKINLVIDLAKKTKTLADSVKNLFDKTISSSDLPQTSAAVTSLSGLKTQAVGFQTQANAAITQANAAQQSLINVPLTNSTTLDSLQKAYDLAVKQEEQASQSLNSLKTGNKGQRDAVDYANQSANNLYASTKLKLDSQVSVAKSQVDIASLQYQNAVATLQGLYDVHQAVTPIDGVVTQKFISEGESISQGQLLATVSQSERVKLLFFTDQDNLSYFQLGQAAQIKDSDGNVYPGKVTSITPQADSLTKRFQIEVQPDQPGAAPTPQASDKQIQSNQPAQTGQANPATQKPASLSANFVLGTVMDVVVPIEKKAKKTGLALLPLSAIEVGQNGNFIFFIKDGLAAKAPAEIANVEGENAEVRIDLPGETLIITDGNKFIQEGDSVTVKTN